MSSTLTPEILAEREPRSSLKLSIEGLFAVGGVLVAIVRSTPPLPPDAPASFVLAQGAFHTGAAATGWAEAPVSVHGPGRGAPATSGLYAAAAPAARWSDENTEVDVTVESGGTRLAARLAPHRIASPQDLSTLPMRGTVARALAAAGHPDLARIVASEVALRPAADLGPHGIDRVVATGGGQVIEAWVANAGSRHLSVCSADLQHWAHAPAIAVRPRADIDERLQSAGIESSDDSHGLDIVLPAAPGSNVRIYLVEKGDDGRRATFFGPLSHRVEADEGLALELAKTAFGEIGMMNAAEIDAVYRPLLSPSRGEPRAQRIDLGPPRLEGEPLASIIMPLYGDAFFVNCAIHLQRVLDARFELVLTVDDPRIWSEVQHAFKARSRELRLPTVLLGNLDNYGFGPANNLATRAAAGDVLFLMNSDVLIDGPAALASAADAIRQRAATGQAPLVVGFSLAYEDGTIQHVGMTFERSPMVANLYLAEHPGKGLPFAHYRGPQKAPARAVTAALMGLSASFYHKLGGFDPRFERGDFEDADFCLRARRAGADIEVHIEPGLYHLERQSVALMGDSSMREMVTYMNCVEFNRRWAREFGGVRVLRRGGAMP